MNEVWNLDPIYKGFADPAFAEDMERLEKKVAEMTAAELATYCRDRIATRLAQE